VRGKPVAREAIGEEKYFGAFYKGGSGDWFRFGGEEKEEYVISEQGEGKLGSERSLGEKPVLARGWKKAKRENY